MEAYILEIGTATGWRRGGETFWDLSTAEAAGRRLIRRKLARRIRVLPLQVSLDAVSEFPQGEGSP